MFHGTMETWEGQVYMQLSQESDEFCTIALASLAGGEYRVTGHCRGNGDLVYAKIVIDGKSTSGSVRKKYMTSLENGWFSFQITLRDVPPGSGYLFLSLDGGTGTLSFDSLALLHVQPEAPISWREEISPCPAVIDSDYERIDRIAHLTIPVEKWSVRHPDRLQISAKGKDSATVMTVKHQADAGKLITEHFPYNFCDAPLTRRIDLPLPLPTDFWTKYNQLSAWVRADIPHNRVALWFDMTGPDLPPVQVCCPLIGGEWVKISICWNHLSLDDIQRIRGTSLGFVSLGAMPGDDNNISFEFKDFRLENVQALSGLTWEAFPEKIIVPQTGYAPGESKQAILCANHQAEEFALFRGEEKVFSGKLLPATYRTGVYLLADFTEFTTPGTYRVASGNLRSVPFKIGYDHLLEAAEKSRHFMHCMRSGCATPAHPECLMDDARRGDNGQQIDVSGGWFDASDNCSFHSMAATSVTRPLNWAVYRFNIPELYDEARWGGLLLGKLFDEETGLPFTVANHFSIYRAVKKPDMDNPDPITKFILENNGKWKMNKYWTDNIPGTGDERSMHFAKVEGACSPHDRYDYHLGLTAAGGWFSIAAKPEDKTLADKAQSASQRHFQQIDTMDNDTLKANGIIPFSRNLTLARLYRLENLLTTWISTRQPALREQMAKIVQEVLAAQQRKWFLGKENSAKLGGWFNSTHNSGYDNLPAVANVLSLYAEQCASKKEYLQILLALRIYADGFLLNHAMRMQPFNIPYPMVSGRSIKAFASWELGRQGNKTLHVNMRRRFMSEVTGALALDACATAVFLGTPEVQDAASEFLRYNLGENQSGRSLMADVGANENRLIMSTVLGWIPGMMANPDVQNEFLQVPYHRNCGRYEIYTQAQGAYTAALCVLSAPAKITLQGYEKAVAVDSVTKHEVKTENGELLLPGRGTWDIRLSDGSTWPLTVCNGEKRQVFFDKHAPLVLGKLQMSDKGLSVEVRNCGNLPAVCRLNGHGENLTLSLPDEFSLKAGECKTIHIPVTLQNNEEAAALALWHGENYRNAQTAMLQP